MENNNINRIIRKYLSERLLPETEEKVQRWLIREKDQEVKEKASLDYWNDLEATTDPTTYAALERVNLRTGHNKEHLANIASYRKFTRVAAVFIPLLILAGGLLFYLPFRNEMISISTAYGEQRHLFLPDSSELWLNAGSSITYPETFSGDNRLVTLNGEAYFAVRKNAAQPFIVETSGLTVKVLGTRFNVKAYSNEDKITTTLTSGKVEINTPTRDTRILQPNEQLTYDIKTSDISLANVNSSDVDSWTIGKLIFTNATVEDIFRTLERHYDIVIDGKLEFSSTKRYTVKFLKNENLNETFDILSDIIGFNYQQHKGKIVLTNKSPL